MTEINITQYYNLLHKKCGDILSTSLSASNLDMVAASHQFVAELEDWCRVLCRRTEVGLLKVAAMEYNSALLALVQGHYRYSFKALRLVLELALQAVHLSTNELWLREWIDNRKDTMWGSIISNEDGVFSTRFAQAFFPSLTGHIQYYQSLAISIYRECSECVHGNMPNHVQLPSALEFDEATFSLWHSKADIVALIIHFALSLRYIKDLSEEEVTKLEPFLSDRLGHLEDIRHLLGGPAKG